MSGRSEIEIRPFLEAADLAEFLTPEQLSTPHDGTRGKLASPDHRRLQPQAKKGGVTTGETRARRTIHVLTMSLQRFSLLSAQYLTLMVGGFMKSSSSAATKRDDLIQ